MQIESLLQTVRTPRKLGRHLLTASYRKGAFDSHAVDCPFPFFHDGCYWLMHVGWDGTGYQTGVARSDDLLAWDKQGILFGRGPKGSVTAYNAAMTCIMRDNELFGPGSLRKVDGRYVGTYHAYPDPGYEAGPGVIGLCSSDDLRNWEVGDPILEPNDACAWESGGLYKSWLMEAEGTYYLFYNARDQKDKSRGPWKEETGVAVSSDLVTWERHPANPLLKVGPPGAFDDRFASDPCVFRHGAVWVMFYFGNCSDGHARNGVAFSEDLVHWAKGDEVLVDVGPPGSIDATHAHKPGMISKDGVLYHFHSAVGPCAGERVGDFTPGEMRGITLATS